MLQYQNGAYVSGPPPAAGQFTGCYIRLSQEDGSEGDSNSVQNQRELLRKFCEDNSLPAPRYFIDDGYSGTNFDRPGYQEMMEYVEQGRVGTIIVKDHSRLGRNRLMVGLLMERFEDMGVRYVAVTDNIDSSRGFDDMVAFRELFNEFYPRDTSKKVRAVFANKGSHGERLCTHVPYGYMGDKHGWEIDEEAAAVVREIFALCIAGLGPSQIARRLSGEGHLNPTAYRLSKGLKTVHAAPDDPYRWEAPSVSAILEHQEYVGDTVNFKTHKKSYKSKKVILNPKSEWKIFRDTHPAIIDRETFERVQELRKHKRRNTKSGKQSMFSGLVYCADCGAKLHYCTCKRYDETQDHFRCSNYKSNTGSCTAHFIREVVLRDLALAHLRDTVAYVQDYETEFIQAVTDKSDAERKKDLSRKRRELAQAEKRLKELDLLFQRIYEDNVAGKLSDERFSKLSQSYETEQSELTGRATLLRAEFEQEQAQAVNVAQFITLVRKYSAIEELTPTILHEFVERIIVHAPDNSTGRRTQEIEIVYNFVGLLPALTVAEESA